jgi:hypothetical protein
MLGLDCFQSLFTQRVTAVLKSSGAGKSSNGDEGVAQQHTHTLRHYSCLTLPHLMALISRPTPTSIATDVSLIVIDSLSALVNAAVPRSLDSLWDKGKKGTFFLLATSPLTLRFLTVFEPHRPHCLCEAATSSAVHYKRFTEAGSN